MYKSVSTIAALAAVLSLSACNTIVRGSDQAFSVQSTPPGATVKTSNGLTCPSTPCEFKVPRKNGFDVTVSKEGYADSTTSVTSSMSSNGTLFLIGNVVIFGGILGLIVDVVTGATNDVSPSTLEVNLNPTTAPAATPAAAPVAAAGSTAPLSR